MYRVLRRLGPVARDLLRLLIFAVGYIVTAVVPARFDPWVARRLTALFARVGRRRIRDLATNMRVRLPRLPEDDPDGLGLALAHYAMRIDNIWVRLRGLHSPLQHLIYELEGRHHYDSAVNAGKGVILWRMRFCNAPSVNAALAQHRIAPVHLSMAFHGASSRTWIARRLVSPIYVRSEAWNLRERVVIPADGSLGYMRVLMECLRCNGTLSIFGEGEVGRQTIATRFLDTTAHFPTGSPALAYRHGSVLLPVHAERTGVCRYRVVIEEPIQISKDLKRDEFIRQAVIEFSDRLESQILARPADWTGWTGWLTRIV